MSRAFVNEDSVHEEAAALPERPVSDAPNYVTPTGLQQLRDRLAALNRERAELRDRDEIAARDRLNEVERDLRYYTVRVDTARLVPWPQHPPEKVIFGCRVRVATPDGKVRDYVLVGEDEADADQGLVSWVSPLGRALLGASVGEEVTWHRPAGDTTLEVMAIDKP